MSPTSDARLRLLRTAADLFYAEGINNVGVDRLLSEAGVTRATMYRHFAGKEDLVAAFLERENSLQESLVARAKATKETPHEQLEAVVDALAHDAGARLLRGDPFGNAASEFPDEGSTVRAVVRHHRAWLRETLAALAAAAGLEDPIGAAVRLMQLHDGLLVGRNLDGDQAVEIFRAAARDVIRAGVT